jgi:hypothetical protein
MYSVVRPPFEKDFREMEPDELKAYFDWFLGLISERVQELADEVRRAPGFEDWTPDCSPESLGPLGQWFASHVERRPTSPQEMAQMREGLRGELPESILPTEQLTDRTYSLAFDVGTYLSQVFIKNCPGASWQQIREDKEMNDYGQPVLVGMGPLPCSPLLLATVLAHGLAKKTKKPGRLREVYEVWAKNKFLFIFDCG